MSVQVLCPYFIGLFFSLFAVELYEFYLLHRSVMSPSLGRVALCSGFL